ncbi:MAG: hypothetical protein LBS57_10075 [Treponema sp.]|jgi:hypothetical protein|nr:hypothetical protein [Treponema sp.]
MEEKDIATLNDLFSVLDEYSGKEFYYRGEIKDYNTTACLPAFLRDPGKNFNFEALDNGVLKQKLEELGIGFPYTPPADNSTKSNIMSALTSSYYWSFLKWGEDKLEALMSHYSPDFKAVDKATKKPEQEYEYYSRFLSPRYLDITSDIMVALHFACSEHRFLPKNSEPISVEPIEDGFLFVFDVNEIEKKEFLKLVSYPGYSYFCKEESGDKLYFQSFDRITRQRGAFLAPKRNGNNKICYAQFKGEIKSCLHTKFTIKSSFKKDLYEFFGKEKGLDYYFPKIPCTFPKEGNEIQQAYAKLEGMVNAGVSPNLPGVAHGNRPHI